MDNYDALKLGGQISTKIGGCNCNFIQRIWYIYTFNLEKRIRTKMYGMKSNTQKFREKRISTQKNHIYTPAMHIPMGHE